MGNLPKPKWVMISVGLIDAIPWGLHMNFAWPVHAVYGAMVVDLRPDVERDPTLQVYSVLVLSLNLDWSLQGIRTCMALLPHEHNRNWKQPLSPQARVVIFPGSLSTGILPNSLLAASQIAREQENCPNALLVYVENVSSIATTNEAFFNYSCEAFFDSEQKLPCAATMGLFLGAKGEGVAVGVVRRMFASKKKNLP
ncbi:hypothetical protein VNO77_03639 [Canavalia gladiata]|uniref:Uncharacterized protein n=1 Tax=Canavalia gladiata TaxID=3824 RepID=A0AAN9N0R0_CANGL